MGWIDTKNGGVINKHPRGWLARPDCVGTDKILVFTSRKDAVDYAEGRSGKWSGWGSYSHIPGAIDTAY